MIRFWLFEMYISDLPIAAAHSLQVEYVIPVCASNTVVALGCSAPFVKAPSITL